MAARLAMHRERQLVTARFAGDAQIATGPLPLRSVSGDSSTAGPRLGEQVRQFVSQSSLNFCALQVAQFRIERDSSLGEMSHTGGRAQAGIPLHANVSH